MSHRSALNEPLLKPPLPHFMPPSPTKLLNLRPATLLAAAALASLALSACSGSSGNEGKVVASVGDTPITQSALSHWMATMVAGDYRELNDQVSPEGLVSDPPNYQRCVRAAKQIPTTSGKHSGDPELRLKCRQLYAAVQEQALTFLISALWSIERGAEHGEHASQGEISRTLNNYRYQQWPNPAQFRRYLAEERRSLSDERYLVKRNILNQKAVERLKRQTGGQQAALVKLVNAEDAKWAARTDCKPGYRSTQCKQYRGSSGVAPSAAVLVERLKAGGK
jgi:hypothetical protein